MPCDLGDERRVAHRRGIDRHLVGTGPQQLHGIVDRPNAAAHCYWNKDVACRGADNVGQMVTSIQAGNAIHVDQLVHPLPVVSKCMVGRRADDAQAFQMNALDQVWTLDIEPSDQAQIAHVSSVTNPRAKPRDATSIRCLPSSRCVPTANCR